MSAPHDVRKNFRLTAKEAAKLSAFAAEAEVTESEYVRALIADPGHVFTAERDVLGRMLRELKRQGVNLNQIAHRVNMIGENSDNEDPRFLRIVDEVSGAMAAVTDAVAATQQALAKTILGRHK